ncbi:hypothetical protein CCR94_22030 [Rhodoblastus sphagnicola]|uniref:Uncharacterized protein n=1 Tax=Rhodoblastus sphagnicola TaxID=333368 RepID=A0A2S6MWA7_9HYPH|nr:hypothetical protein [Rhodoblastus sphagnicola]MBB4196686.1 hypothetical protein [Rhodoblastus sphagnicola]PPQ26646.1 hypothetical protein CCR94_22030 [Rhodoblastus sphagnicola]
MSAPQTQSPAPLGGGNRAKGNRNEAFLTIAKPEPEGDFVALYIARRFGLALPLARTIATLASLGRAFQ